MSQPDLPVSAPHAVSRSLAGGVWASLLGALRAFVTSEIGGKFRLMFGAIVALLVGISGLNVFSSYG